MVSLPHKVSQINHTSTSPITIKEMATQFSYHSLHQLWIVPETPAPAPSSLVPEPTPTQPEGPTRSILLMTHGSSETCSTKDHLGQCFAVSRILALLQASAERFCPMARQSRRLEAGRSTAMLEMRAGRWKMERAGKERAG